MDGFSHGLQEELIIGVKAPVGEGTLRIMFHINPPFFWSFSYGCQLAFLEFYLSVILVSSMHFSSRDFSYCKKKEKKNGVIKHIEKRNTDENKCLCIKVYSVQKKIKNQHAVLDDSCTFVV